MAKRMKQVIRNLDQEIGHDYNQMIDDLVKNLRISTPVAGGTARAGWKRSKARSDLKDGPIIENPVPYIDILEQGHSDQAPRGIIGPAIKRTRSLK